ncbi:hypothetical protein HW555_004735 [Spodoptera exigua]|uniref:Mpv17-like protein n=1 Tax=Spodoptera exigua TaxID=7107 RepID=A0A835GIH5_SPOEX|nr:hypothetical protein HW555_004735 [Spodoptera exigua]
MGAYSKFINAFKKYPLLRGMASYSIIWPGSSLIQQTVEGKTIDNYDWWRCARYGLYGSCYVAPTLYSWLTIANIMWPGSSIRAGIIKTFVETITYTPFAMCSFYFGMSLLESKPFHEAIAEVEAKFLPTYKVCFYITHGLDPTQPVGLDKQISNPQNDAPSRAFTDSNGQRGEGRDVSYGGSSQLELQPELVIGSTRVTRVIKKTTRPITTL